MKKEKKKQKKNVQLANIVNYPKYYMCVGLFFNCKEINILKLPISEYNPKTFRLELVHGDALSP